VLLRRQPYLAGVLPMYACFALAAPLALRRDQQHEQRGHHEGAIDLEGALDEALTRGGLGAARAERGPGGSRGEAAEEYEHFGRVAQRVGVQRDAREDAAADVIDDDDQQDETAKEIKFDKTIGWL
jgi:hypothetical protein